MQNQQCKYYIHLHPFNFAVFSQGEMLFRVFSSTNVIRIIFEGEMLIRTHTTFLLHRFGEINLNSKFIIENVKHTDDNFAEELFQC